MKSLRTHWPAILAGLIVGLAVSLPNIVFTHSAEYRGLPIMETDAETMYISRIHAAYHGCIMGCNPYIKEYGYLYPSFDPSISEAILALPGIVFHLSIITLKLIYDFLLPFALALLAYSLIWRMTRRKDLSFVGTLFIFLGYNILNPISILSLKDIWSLVAHFNLPPSPSYATNFLLYARPVNPQFSSIVFLIFLHCLLSFLRNKNKKTLAFLALTYAFSFYIYFYLFSFETVVLSILALWSILKRDWHDLWLTASVIVFGIIFGTPVIKELWDLTHHPLYGGIPMSSMLPNTHLPVFTAEGVLAFSLFIIATALYYKRVKKSVPEEEFLILLIVSGAGILNQHVITGVVLQNFHYEWYYLAPIYIITLTHIAKRLEARLSWIWLFTLTLLPVANALAIDHRSYSASLNTVEQEQAFVPALEWLDAQAPGKVVYTYDSLASRYVPIYTRDYVFWTYFAMGFITLPDRRQDIKHSSDPSYIKSFEDKYGIDYLLIPKDALPKFKAILPSKPLYEDGYNLVYSAHEDTGH